jgi:hypothetical protein
MQGGAAAHSVTYFINVLNEVVEDLLVSSRPWPARSPDLYLCDFYVGKYERQSVYK